MQWSSCSKVSHQDLLQKERSRNQLYTLISRFINYFQLSGRESMFSHKQTILKWHILVKSYISLREKNDCDHRNSYKSLGPRMLGLHSAMLQCTVSDFLLDLTAAFKAVGDPIPPIFKPGISPLQTMLSLCPHYPPPQHSWNIEKIGFRVRRCQVTVQRAIYMHVWYIYQNWPFRENILPLTLSIKCYLSTVDELIIVFKFPLCIQAY